MCVSVCLPESHSLDVAIDLRWLPGAGRALKRLCVAPPIHVEISKKLSRRISGSCHSGESMDFSVCLDYVFSVCIY